MARRPRQRGAAPAGGARRAEPPVRPTDAHTAQLRAALAKNPDDLDARLELARHLLRQRDLMGVWNETQYVLERQPGHPRALAYQSLVRLAMGQGEMAVEMLKQAIAADARAASRPRRTWRSSTRASAAPRRPRPSSPRSRGARRRTPSGCGRRLCSSPSRVRNRARRRRASAPTRACRPRGRRRGAAESAAEARAPAGGLGGPGAARRRDRCVFGWIEADAGVAARVSPGSVIFLTVRPAGVARGRRSRSSASRAGASRSSSRSASPTR